VDLPGYEQELATFLEEVQNELAAVMTMTNPVAQMRAVVAHAV
jgi:hypothetical protein